MQVLKNEHIYRNLSTKVIKDKSLLPNQREKRKIFRIKQQISAMCDISEHKYSHLY